MRLAIGRAARHGGADARRYRRIEKIDIEADVQHAVARLYPLDDPPDQNADSEFVDRAHVGDRDAAIADEVSFKRIDRPDSEQIEPRGASPSRPSRPGSPQRNAADMPCMLPVTVVAGVL